MSMERRAEMPETIPMVDKEIVSGYEDGEVDGTVVMERLYDILGFDTETIRGIVLKNSAGQELLDDEGQTVTAVDYLKIASQHGSAEDMILNFMEMSPYEEDYRVTRDAMQNIIGGYLGLETETI